MEKFRGMYITHISPGGAVCYKIEDPDGSSQEFSGSWDGVLEVAKREYDGFAVVAFEHGVIDNVDLDGFRKAGMAIIEQPLLGRAYATRRAPWTPSPESTGCEPGLEPRYGALDFSPTGYC